MCKEERSYSKVCLVPRLALKFHAMLFDYRCFTFGIGSGASTDLVEGLAKAGGGTSEFVKEGERMQAKVSLWHHQIRGAHRHYRSLLGLLQHY